MPGDTLYVRNLQIESNTSASGNGFSSTGYGNLSYDGTEILGTGGVGNWTKDGTSIYYDGGNVGIQNTNPQHALSIGSPSNLYVDTTTSKLYLIKQPTTSDDYPILTRRNDTGEITQSGYTPSDLLTLSITNLTRIDTNEFEISQLQGDLANQGLQQVTNIDNTTTNNIGIQNTNPQHALSIGSPSNLYVDTVNSQIIIDVDLIPRLNGQVNLGSGPLRIGTLHAVRLDTVSDSTIGLRSINGGTQTIRGNTVLIDPFNGQTTFGSPSNVYVDTSTRSLVFSDNFNRIRTNTGRLNFSAHEHKFYCRTSGGAELGPNPIVSFGAVGASTNVHVYNDLIVDGTISGSASASDLTTGTLPNGRLGSNYTGVGSITLGSSKDMTVSSGQLRVGTSGGFGKVCIENDTTHNAPFPNRTIFPHLYLQEKEDETVRFHIGVNKNDTVNKLFVNVPASHTANCLYFIPNHSIISPNTEFSYGAFIRDVGTSFQLNFTGQHRCKSENIDLYSNTYVGYIVGSNGSYSMIGSTVKTTSNNIHINECLPYVSLSNTENQSNVFGVISNIEDKNVESREMTHGVWASVVPKTKGDSRVIVNSLGEGAIWVSNINGPLINGDYITTSSIPGLGMKQNENQLMNYTVAKITMDCDFDPIEEPIMVARVEDIHSNVEQCHNNTYTITQVNIVYDQDTGHWVQKEETITKTKREQVFEEVDLYNEQSEIIGKHRVPVYETITRQENVLDENGQLVFDDSGQTQPAYLVKYVSSDGTILDSEQPGCYKMAFVGCTYHCG